MTIFGFWAAMQPSAQTLLPGLSRPNYPLLLMTCVTHMPSLLATGTPAAVPVPVQQTFHRRSVG